MKDRIKKRVAYFCTKVDVGRKEFLLGTHPDRRTEQLLRSRHVLLSEFEIRKLDPELPPPKKNRSERLTTKERKATTHFGKCEGSMGDQLKSGFVDLSSAFVILIQPIG